MTQGIDPAHEQLQTVSGVVDRWADITALLEQHCARELRTEIDALGAEMFQRIERAMLASIDVSFGRGHREGFKAGYAEGCRDSASRPN